MAIAVGLLKGGVFLGDKVLGVDREDAVNSGNPINPRIWVLNSCRSWRDKSSTVVQAVCQYLK